MCVGYNSEFVKTGNKLTIRVISPFKEGGRSWLTTSAPTPGDPLSADAGCTNTCCPPEDTQLQSQSNTVSTRTGGAPAMPINEINQ